MIQVSYEALKKRYDQGWLLEIIDDLDRLMERIKEARQRQEVSCLNNWLRTRRKNHKITFFFLNKKFWHWPVPMATRWPCGNTELFLAFMIL